MRTLTRALAFGVCLVLLAGVRPAAGAPPLPSPRIVDLKPRVVTLKPRIIDLKPKHRKRTYTVDADVLFAFDSAKLSSGATNVLNDVVKTLERPGVTSVTIIGYTDSVGSDAYNLSLSRRRAAAVLVSLRDKVANSHLHYAAVGKGEQNPVAANQQPDGSDNPAGRRKNRRVVISYR